MYFKFQSQLHTEPTIMDSYTVTWLIWDSLSLVFEILLIGIMGVLLHLKKLDCYNAHQSGPPSLTQTWLLLCLGE